MTNPFDSNRDPSGNQQGGNNGQNGFGSFGSNGGTSNGGNAYGSDQSGNQGGFGNNTTGGNSYGDNSYGGNTYGSDQNSYGNNAYGGDSYGGNSNSYGGNSYGENSYGAGQNTYGQGYQDPNAYGAGYQQQGAYGAGYQQQGAYGAGYQQQGAYAAGYQQQGAYAAGYQQQNGLTVSPPDAMDSVGQAFKGYFKQPMPGALAALAYFAVMGIGIFLPMFVFGIGAASTAATSYDPVTDTYSSGGAAGLGVLSILVLIVVYLSAILITAWMYAGCYSASRKIANGETVSFVDYFKGDNLKGIFGVHLCYIVIVVIGSFLIIPGIVAAVLFWAAPGIKADDPEKSIGDCFKESMNLVTSNFGQMLLFYIVFSIVVSLFMLIPIVGVLCALPLRGLGEFLFVRAVRQRPAMRWA
ncbi:hypothetical protein [Corynebacterium minutissimum]|uniref:hypothetical protein n=1 Tax=Corynebacterium minutissimum TaxID=38301 RepID=UPI001EF20097|nr:hypothetical protein [Corynebacterium minutissimum]MCG7229030.1 hypothetical protein [Corynebacterium minutissimum]MCG7238147.1 hypothetical protein [Corynebacterium minutissimum]